jgi:large subunit ribosomal protein L6
MSRVGKKMIEIPSGVTLAVAGKQVTVKGPKGQLVQHLVFWNRSSWPVEGREEPGRPSHGALHGTMRANRRTWSRA